MTDTIFALSSGAPPAAIAVVRISGPAASAALVQLAGSLPAERHASYRRLHGADGAMLDHGLVLWMEGPKTATGEDLAELHLHGGRAVIAAVEAVLADMPELRRATPGEFTRRAFVNGRIDLAEAEGLADLLSAETELQRKAAISMAGGALSVMVAQWRETLLETSAAVESVLDFSDEDDVSELPAAQRETMVGLAEHIGTWLSRPKAEILREGFKIVLAGPPNAGKSTLFNVLVEKEAAITAPTAGTTRDILTAAVAIDGVPIQFFDTAGLRDDVENEIEGVGIARAEAIIEDCDLVLWLGDEGAGPPGSWELEPQIDREDQRRHTKPRHRVSAMTGEGLDGLRRDIVDTVRQALPKPGDAALNQRQHQLLGDARGAIVEATGTADLLIQAEHLRQARVAFDAILGRTTTEDMLDTLFGRFCIGK